MKQYCRVYMYYVLLGAALLVFPIFVTGCDKKMEEENKMKEVVESPGASIAEMSKMRILFGHVSLGNNIIAGLEDIKAKDKKLDVLAISKIESPQEMHEHGFYHFIVRRNGYPKEKCDNFKRMLMQDNLGESLDVAFFKFCYVDIEKDTDIDEVFKYYLETIQQVRSAYPNLKILHVTVPLYSHGRGIKGFIKRLFKTDYNNTKRNEYNEKLRNKFAGIAPIYDLADIESTRPDGTRASFKHNGETYFSLVNEYTHDGGHLNEVGRRRAAMGLLEVLCKVVSQK